MKNIDMPIARNFGWDLKPVSSSLFNIHKRDNGQFCVVLNHALLRGVRSEMIHWWFQNFANLRVKLSGVNGYENTVVPAYLLWHPIDHVSATFTGNTGPNNTARQGCSIQIREAMQYDVYEWKYPVDTELKVFYVGNDGWAMGKEIPVFGPAMVLRINYKDVYENNEHLGVHYHYEVVIGVSGHDPISKFINQRITKHFSPEFFEAWQRHNVIEVGTFEDFLSALYDQRNDLDNLSYSKQLRSSQSTNPQTAGFDADLMNARVEGYRNSKNPYEYQAFRSVSFL